MTRTHILKSTDNFSLGGHSTVKGFPLFLGRDGRVVEELTQYFRYRFSIQHSNRGTLKDEAYILREWWDYIADANVEYHQVSEKLFMLWIRNNQQSMENVRVQRKIEVVHRFQRFTIVRVYGEDFPLGIFSEERPKFQFPRSSLRSRGSRPTPDFNDVEVVLSYLGAHADEYLASRNYLMARWMSDTGLRAAGVAQLDIGNLIDAMSLEGIHLEASVALSDLVHSDQDRLVTSIQALHMKNRQYLYVRVTEKGNKTRYVQVPIDLFVETIEFVFGERRNCQIKHSKGVESKEVPDALWISLKTKRALSSAGIGDILKRAFTATGTKGSGHRLRAYYACSLVLKLYRQQKQMHGKGWDAPAVLLQAAELLGQSQIESLRPYLNRAIREDAFSPH